MRIVITGGLGHIGSRLLQVLPQQFPGAELVVLDNLLTQRYCALFNLPSGARFRLLEQDILKADLLPVLQGAGAVVHLAAITDAASSFDKAAEVEAVNFTGTMRVAEACAALGVPLLFFSTTSVYGVQDGVVDEQCPLEDLKPQSPYAESKLKSEQWLAALPDLRHVVLRFGTIFGVSPGIRFHTAVNKFVWQAMNGQPITVWRTALHQKRPYLDLNDGVAAIAHVIRQSLFNRQVYNVVTENYTVNDIVETIRQHVPDLQVELVDSRIMNQLSYHVSGARFAATGFGVNGSLQQAIADTVALLSGLRA